MSNLTEAQILEIEYNKAYDNGYKDGELDGGYEEHQRIIKGVEEHSTVEQLPLRDGGVLIRTIPEDSWQSLKERK